MAGGRRWPAIEISSLDDLIHAALIDYDIAAIDEDAARVFFHGAAARDDAVAALRAQFPALQITSIDVEDEDWAARSQANLKAIRVGNIVVAPPWDADLPELKFRPTKNAPTPVIVIQPSMGFGTGHHATTRLCLAHMQQIDLRNRRVIDVGTGSGVLAIAASRLGASHVLAIDDDPDAIASARENLELNPGAHVTLDTLDLRAYPGPTFSSGAYAGPNFGSGFDLVVANLTGGLLVSAAPALTALAAPGGRLVLSGFMRPEEAGVRAAFSGCMVDARSQEEEWECVTLIRNRP